MADTHGIAVEDIVRQMAVGLKVYDVNGDRLGTVQDYDTDTGWMQVVKGVFIEKDLYIPFSAITSIDPREIYLALPKDVLARDYANPPARTTTTEVDPGPGARAGGAIALTTEASGYDGAPIVVDRAHVDELKARIKAGMRVYTAGPEEVGKIKRYGPEEVGTIKHYDPVTGWMLVETGVFSHHDLYIPATLVDDVDRADDIVMLAVNAQDLQRLQRTAPTDAVVVEAQERESQ
jgi:hypothetical protein